MSDYYYKNSDYEEFYNWKRKKHYDDSRKKSCHDDWEKKNCCEKKAKSKSAFRAVSLAPRPVNTPFTFVKVFFQMEDFDLGNEYNPATSTFVAKESGVYSFTSAIQFDPTNNDVDYEIVIQFVVNGVFVNGGETDYTGFNAAFFNLVEVNDILQLNAGDRVEVFARSTTPGTIVAFATRFAGVREQ